MYVSWRGREPTRKLSVPETPTPPKAYPCVPRADKKATVALRVIFSASLSIKTDNMASRACDALDPVSATTPSPIASSSLSSSLVLKFPLSGSRITERLASLTTATFTPPPYHRIIRIPVTTTREAAKGDLRPAQSGRVSFLIEPSSFALLLFCSTNLLCLICRTTSVVKFSARCLFSVVGIDRPTRPAEYNDMASLLEELALLVPTSNVMSTKDDFPEKKRLSISLRSVTFVGSRGPSRFHAFQPPVTETLPVVRTGDNETALS